MALREVRKIGDDILRKKSRKIEKIDEKILQLLEDMAETMYHEDGVGLAAPQVGMLKRIIVVDTDGTLYKLINPEILEYKGEQVDEEGCLSVPNNRGPVKRPQSVIVTALNEKGEEINVSGEGLLARALCHEIDHLNGILFVDKIERM